MLEPSREGICKAGAGYKDMPIEQGSDADPNAAKGLCPPRFYLVTIANLCGAGVAGEVRPMTDIKIISRLILA